MVTYTCIPPPAIRLGRLVDEGVVEIEQACRAVERAFADGVTANTRAMRIMEVLGSTRLVDIVAHAIARPQENTLGRDTYWQRCGGMARELHTAEARAAIAAIRSTIEADDACT